MKKFTILATTIILSALNCFAQNSGSLDESFAEGGIAILNEQNLDVFHDVIVQDDEKILAVGLSFDQSFVASAYAVRYMPDGTLDPDFAVGGIFTYSLDFEALVHRVLINSQGKIILVGSTTDYQDYKIMLIQLNQDGSLDNAFGDEGVALATVGLVEQFQNDQAAGAALDANDNIIVSGTSLNEDYMGRPVVLRFSPTGELDASFGINGVATMPVTSMENIFDCVRVQPDGKIVAAGHYANSELWFVFLMARFNIDGTLDTSFGEEGIVLYSYSDVDDEAYDMVIAPDGKIVVAGFSGSQDFNYNTLVMRFTEDGVLDETFGTNGVVAEDNGSFDVASGVRILSDGRIVVGGTSGEAPPNMSNMAAWVYNSDGTPDMNFGNEGFATHMIPTTSVLVNGMDVQADGKIILVGQSRPGGSLNNFIVARLENSISLSSAEIQLPQLLDLYPNPVSTSGEIYLSVSNDQNTYSTLSFYTLDGRLAHAVGIAQLQGMGAITLRVPDGLTKGVYLIRLEGKGIYSPAARLVILN